MGGHGGLNILPQKKWNIYRNDVQYKVNYDENKLIKEEREKERKKTEYLFENNINELKNNLNKNKDKIEYNGHINLFAEEEKEMNRKKKIHEEYLIKKGHYIYSNNKFDGVNCIYDKKNNVKIISDFDKIKISQNEWFLNRQKKNSLLRDNEANELENKNNNVFFNCYNDEEENFKQKKALYENEACESGIDVPKHANIKKEKNKNKYEHIKKLIKYKKEKEKKKKKKKHKEKKMKIRKKKL